MDQMTLATLTGRPQTVAIPRLNRVRALFEPLLAHQRILRRIIELKLNDWLSVPLLDLRDPQAVRDRALARHQHLPTRDALHAWDVELSRALEGKADEKTLSFLLSLMLDGFPQAKTPSVDIYVDAMLLLVAADQISPEILAAAVSGVWRSQRFPPSISEFLDECRDITKSATSARRVIRKMIALRDNAEDALMATGDLTEVFVSHRP